MDSPHDERMKTAMRRLESARYLRDGGYHDDAVGRAYGALGGLEDERSVADYFRVVPSAEEADEAIGKAENFVKAVRREYLPHLQAAERASKGPNSHSL